MLARSGALLCFPSKTQEPLPKRHQSGVKKQHETELKAMINRVFFLKGFPMFNSQPVVVLLYSAI